MGIKEKLDIEGAWGLSANIDLYNCNPETIRDSELIGQYVVDLCDLIQVKRFGECVVVNFGEDERIAGFSMTQLIETSLVSGHFANQTNTAYLDVFSCKYFDPQLVGDFSKEFFEADEMILKHTLRK